MPAWARAARGTGANAAANQLFHAKSVQEVCQSAVAAAQNGHHLGMGHLAVLHLCHQELTAVAQSAPNT